MSDELKPVRCGCGGEAEVRNYIRADHVEDPYHYVQCDECRISTVLYPNEAEAIEAWNTAMGERTAKVVEHDASVTDTDGYIYHRTEYLCGACKKKVLSGDDYCSHCGTKLDWSK